MFSIGIEPVKPAFPGSSVPVVLLTDDNGLEVTSVVVQSILDNSTSDNRYDILIFTENVHDQRKSLIESMANGRANVMVRAIDVGDFSKRLVKEVERNGVSTKLSRDLPPLCFFRLFYPVVCANYEKIISLDYDVVVKCDMQELYQIDLKGHLIAGYGKEYVVNRIPGNRLYGLIGPRFIRDFGIDLVDYVNCGVSVYNVNQMLRGGGSGKIPKNNDRIFSEVATAGSRCNQYCLSGQDQGYWI